ncbi:hypothetical protein ACR6C2_16940 [Streptomyces sp. INA 01156]
MKRFYLDRDELEEMAAKAAKIGDRAERRRALTLVYEECGERASIYHDPEFVVEEFVSLTTYAFQFERALIGGLTNV